MNHAASTRRPRCAVGTVRGTRQAKAVYGVTLFGATGVTDLNAGRSYQPLVAEIVRSLQTRTAPVSPDETNRDPLVHGGGDESKRRGGAPVALAEVLAAQQPANRP